MDFKGSLPLWSEVWSKEALKHKLAQIRPRAFDQGFRMKAYADADFTFPHFKKALELGTTENVPAEIPPGWSTVIGVDLASPTRPGNVIWCGALSNTGVKRPLEIRCMKASSPVVAQALMDVASVWHPDVIVVENNAYQGALIDWVTQYKEEFPYWEAIVPFTTGRNKADPTMGLGGLDVEFMNGSWVVPRDLNPDLNGHEVDCDCGSCTWVREIRLHPNAAQTDTVMGSWFFREGCRRLLHGRNQGPEYEIHSPNARGTFSIPSSEASGY